ncbi:TPA: hypothetical protein ACNZOO_000587 [Streptococcus pyogenes]|nr:hypothetical protein ISR5_1319 [Streptococcus pyogenes]VHE43592.1 Uncharacterised protein [Streptococcus pyogenes]HEQ0616396.1 hypothetical protein [Streptococcus pyogenes]HER8329131.1 hypothetical protein [Streptococcus pyogenes]HER9841587.1 hypothetical protein [Streptococcus pyogenes]
MANKYFTSIIEQLVLIMVFKKVSSLLSQKAKSLIIADKTLRLLTYQNILLSSVNHMVALT